MSVQSLLEVPDMLLNPDFMDEKEMLKKYLGKAVDTIVNQNQKRDTPYFIIYHEKSDGIASNQKIRVKEKLPAFITNSVVFWVDNRRGICEWLWKIGRVHV